MTMNIKLYTLALVACLAAPALAQSTEPQNLGWEQLPRAQQELLIQPTRERWNNASPEQRQKMLQRAQRWQEMTPEERAQARRGRERFEQLSATEQQQMRALYQRTRHMNPTDRRHAVVLYHAMRGMSASERDALRQEWGKMSPTQREAWVEANAPKHPHGQHRQHGQKRGH